MNYYCSNPECPDGGNCGGKCVAYWEKKEPALRLCITRTPEPHVAGEFPMTCYACHIVADS